ncbi:hypothetical protein ACJIZ3_013030 [Penstemon smallii]|uniref:Viral late gene transcription factor 3 zinc ribbon domain-containing protein n=1 Tax=Penstemon smallii TaxID=265156 RepID=A0ABD3UST8_9LAMI
MEAPILANFQAIQYRNSRKGLISSTTIHDSNFSKNKPMSLLLTQKIRPISRICAIDEISGSITSDPEISWEIVLGALAGVTPFVVAGIEFRKRIVAQQQCKVCKGSGLVLRDKKYYFRCPCCGGFLPWQSWRRFFTG